MKHSEIKHEAKQMVIHHGPANVIEFGDEIARDFNVGGADATADERTAIVNEACGQARRVIDFLGYEP